MIFSRRRFVFTAWALLATATAWAAEARKSPTRPSTGAASGGYKGALVMDAATGNVLFEHNAQFVGPPASMTKLMTFAVVFDRLAAGTLALNTPVTVTRADTGMGGTQVWLKEGETYPVEELIYAMMIQSANDCAHALGRTVAGSTEAFVELMNAKATELGMKDSTFRTPHGLPPSNRRVADGDLTSPRDFALLARHLLQKTDVMKYASVRRRNFGEGVRPPDRVIDMVNHNHLLGKVAGVDGLKTGFTNAAGFCLTATAERNGRRVIVVTMGGTDSKARNLSVAELLERGFAALPPAPVANTPFKAAPAPTAAAPSTPPAPEAEKRPESSAPIKLALPKK